MSVTQIANLNSYRFLTIVVIRPFNYKENIKVIGEKKKKKNSKNLIMMT